MITLGIVVLLIGLLCLAIGRAVPNRIAAAIGLYTAIAGAVLLGVGLILYVVNSPGADIDLDTMRAFVPGA